MAKAVLAIVSIALTVFALADCVQTEDDKVRGVPKWAWIVLIVLLPWVGPITWLVVGKDRTRGREKPVQRTGPTAPDEDPDFLRKLDEDVRRERREREHRDKGEGEGTTRGTDNPTSGPQNS